MSRRRILWLAQADARGHLMRAQLLADPLRRRGLEVDWATTSEEAATFLRTFGLEPRVLLNDWHVAFDERQNISRLRTDLGVARYLAHPRGLWHDWTQLEEWAADVDLVVSDSFHPAMVAAPLSRRLGRQRLVFVYGVHLRQALENEFSSRLPRPVANAWASTIDTVLGKAYARIEHGFEAPAQGLRREDRSFLLPPVVAPPNTDPARTREALGVGQNERLAAVYLNPFFRDPALADGIERALAAAGYRMHAVCEGFADRPGWQARDAGLPEVIAAADLLVAAPGMASVGQARTYGTPFLAVVTDQPEQRMNLAYLQDQPWAQVDCCEAGSFSDRLSAALATLPPRKLQVADASVAAGQVLELWADLIAELCTGQSARTLHRRRELARPTLAA